MTEREYYTNSPYVNFCKMEGYLEKQEDEDQRVRMAVYAYAKFSEGKQTLTEIWPLWSDKKSTGGQDLPSWRTTDKETIKEFVKRIKEQNKIG